MSPNLTLEKPRDVADKSALPLDTLVQIATGIASSPLWTAHAHHDPTQRRPVRLLATASYEVWVIGWTAGQSVALHDHGGSRGVLVVVEGVLTELTDTPEGLHREDLPTGTCIALPEELVHEVLNAHPVPATSIHVYSPPLRTMTFYDAADGTPVRREDVSTEEPVLAPVQVSRALHPTGGSHHA